MLDMNAASGLKNRIATEPFVKAISTLIDICDAYSFKGADEFLNALLLIVENLSSN